jgi:DNA-directed RNA polymerase
MKQTTSSTKGSGAHWRDLYLTALFETDKNKLAERIAVAQVAIAARKWEILHSEDCSQERKALETAAFALQALLSCYSAGSDTMSPPIVPASAGSPTRARSPLYGVKL